MQNWPTLLIGVVIGVTLGALLTWLLLRVRYAVPLATAATERDLLRARVDHLTMLADQEAGRHADTVELVAPLRETLVRVETQVHALERDRGEQFARVALELGRVQSSTDGLRDQTASLVGSLASANVRGSWGEVTLRRVLELSGMLARCDFDTQFSSRNHHGAAVRPDVVVNLPGGKHVAVDAKVPLTTFLAAQADGLPTSEHSTAMAAHAKALRGHVDALAGKDYWSALPASPEFVVCFVPGEAILAAALSADPALHEHAMSRKVVLASPATLLAMLRTVAVVWQHDALTEGARELLALGRELTARIGVVGRHTDQVGQALKRSVEAYNLLVGSMENRVLVTARRMHELGVHTEAVAAPRLVQEAPRPLSAAELLDVLDAEVARPQLVDPRTPTPTIGRAGAPAPPADTHSSAAPAAAASGQCNEWSA